MIRMVKLFTVVAIVTGAPLVAGDWNARQAAAYLDARQKAWFAWKPALNAAGGPCVSCHTGVTYLLARPALRRALDEAQPTEYETGLLKGLRARLGETHPFPGFKDEPRFSQSVGVEAVHAALFLAIENAGRPELSSEAQRAFDRMWATQIREGKAQGGWAWFELELDPWETTASPFYGSALAALATGYAPAGYRSRPDVRERIAALTAYLHAAQKTQPLHNRLMLLWASTKLPAVAPEPLRKSIIAEAWKRQQADGGWTAESLGPWMAHPNAPPTAGSNAYVTAFTAFVLRNAGARSDARLVRALDWLRANQDRESGSWAADSMNKQYAPESMMARFMRDAATGFAVLALLQADKP